MTFALTLGCYRLFPFVRLNIAACQAIFPDAPILVSDDFSPESPKIKTIAEEMGASYICTPQRLSHFGGDLRHLLSSIQFAEATQVDVGIKLSLRLVPATPKFREVAERVFSDPLVVMAVPGQIPHAQLVRNEQKFYGGFKILTDQVCIRRGAITAEEVLSTYRSRLASTVTKDWLIETLIDNLSQKHKTAIVDEWSSHQRDESKCFLRKSMGTERDYVQLAESLGLPKERYPLSEWLAMEGKQGYKAKQTTV